MNRKERHLMKKTDPVGYLKALERENQYLKNLLSSSAKKEVMVGDSMVMSLLETHIAPLLHQYSISREAMTQVIARLDELFQTRKGMVNEDVFRERLKLISPQLAAAGTKYKISADALGGVADKEAANWLQTISTIQDEINSYLQGRTDGSNLANLYGHLPDNVEFKDLLAGALKRSRSKMEPWRKVVGQMAYDLEQAEPTTYKNKGGMQRAGMEIIEKLKQVEWPQDKKDACGWLLGFIDDSEPADLRRLGQEVSAAKRDYIKHYCQDLA